MRTQLAYLDINYNKQKMKIWNLPFRVFHRHNIF